MIYKLIVNAAFLAIGYYIGKEVGLAHKQPRKSDETVGTESNPESNPDKDEEKKTT